jgi:hypothetical protein
MAGISLSTLSSVLFVVVCPIIVLFGIRRVWCGVFGISFVGGNVVGVGGHTLAYCVAAVMLASILPPQYLSGP